MASSAGADKSPAQLPPALASLVRLLARLAASEIVLSGALADRVLDAPPFSSETGEQTCPDSAGLGAGIER